MWVRATQPQFGDRRETARDGLQFRSVVFSPVNCRKTSRVNNLYTDVIKTDLKDKGIDQCQWQIVAKTSRLGDPV